MEQIIKDWQKNNYTLESEQENKILEYAHLVHKYNQKFNISGFKTEKEILDKLILTCLEPFENWNVPRGTSIGDLGTGAGIPGIPLAIKYPDLKFTLFDSNIKKIGFINQVCKDLEITNVKTVCGRIEEQAKIYRGCFDWIVSRAFAPYYICTELAMPLLKEEGMLFIYSHDLDVPSYVHDHLKELNSVLLQTKELEEFNLNNGLLFKSLKITDEKFPRRYNVIKKNYKRLI